ncbi:MAG: methyltransferase [Steroidobacteraceae bacterium]
MLLQLNADVLLRLLSAVAEHGIADRLAAGPRTAQELAAAESLDAAALYRVLRYLASRSFFREDDAGRFQLEALGQARCAAGSRDRCAIAASHNLRPAVAHLRAPAGRADPRRQRVRARARPHAVRLPRGSPGHQLDLRSLDGTAVAAREPGDRSALPVRGGHDRGGRRRRRGGLLAAVLERHAHVRGVLFDQAQVITAPDPVLAEPRFAGRWQAVGGDFFEAVPPGGDLYLLKRILHDWDDARAAAITAPLPRGGSAPVRAC